MSKFDYSNFIAMLGNQSYDVAQPTISNSALSYDRKVSDYYPNSEPDFSKPYCSPHPFDVLAIYVLYQNVPLRSFS